jgi:hypothetical protein
VKIHRVLSWVIHFTDQPVMMVYDQMKAIELFAQPNGREMNFEIQERICVLDRPGNTEPTCYLCEREAK